MNLGNKILELRKKVGLSQEELGEKVGVTRQTISNWELGETSPNPEQLKLLSKELNISIDELLDNDTKSILIEKVSNTEKLAGLILKIIKIVLIAVPSIFILLIVLSILYKNIIGKRDTGREIEESIYCSIYGEEHSYSISYEEYTGRIIASGGDSYFYDILDLIKYDDAHQIFNVINDYVKKNGGTCQMINNHDLNDIVNMSIKEGTLTKKSLTVIITEPTDYDISYGEEFWLEKYNYQTSSYEKLKLIGNTCAFNMPAYGATPDKPLELTQNWECMYGSLDKGLYKIVKTAFFDSDTPVTEDDTFYIWTEFIID